jgi:hypothetical protein
MNRLYEIFKTPSGPSTGKALLNYTIFSPSQTGETVPLSIILSFLQHAGNIYFRTNHEKNQSINRSINSPRSQIKPTVAIMS